MSTPTGCCSPQDGPRLDDLVGTVPDIDLIQDPVAYRAEKTGLKPGLVAYHYFEGQLQTAGYSAPLIRIIWSSGRIMSRIQCLTEDQIFASVQQASLTARPHYGDGAYCTLHGDYRSAHTAVIVAHGISLQIATHRAVVLILRPDRLRTFLGTGGVTRSRPKEPSLLRDDLVGMGETTGEIRLLRIEAFDGTDWQRVAVQ